MEKFLREFEDKPSYITDKGNINRPGVSLINNTMEVMYDPFIPAIKFTALEDNSTIGLSRLSTKQTLEYSFDGINWVNMDTSTSVSLTNENDFVYVRGVLSNNNTSSDYTQFKMTGKISASGNCNYLWNYQNPNTPLKNYCGFDLFGGCSSLITAPELRTNNLAVGCYSYMFYLCSGLSVAPELPATTLAENCYDGMFMKCGIKYPPELPATKLSNHCYDGMFYESELVEAPELPATELADYCYLYMFTRCRSLRKGPSILPATTLKTGCYGVMFRLCAITTAPKLPAETLVNDCYGLMFQDCGNLNYVECSATNINANDCLDRWLSGVASTGTFIKNPSMESWPRSASGIPTNWTIQNAE